MSRSPRKSSPEPATRNPPLNPSAPVPPATLAECITAQLAALQPQQLELFDESGNHLGHAGWREGGSHFRVRIVSEIGRAHV